MTFASMLSSCILKALSDGYLTMFLCGGCSGDGSVSL